jgi:hypothetical protein
MPSLDVMPEGGKVFVGSAVHGVLVSDEHGQSRRPVLAKRYISRLDCADDGRTVAAAA